MILTWHPSGVLIVNFEHISHLVYALTTGRKTPISFNLRKYVEKLCNGP